MKSIKQLTKEIDKLKEEKVNQEDLNQLKKMKRRRHINIFVQLLIGLMISADGSDYSDQKDCNHMAKHSYKIADSMIKERNK